MAHFIKLIYPEDYHARFGVHRSRQEKVVEKSLYSNEQLRLFISQGVTVEPVEEPHTPPTIAKKPARPIAKKRTAKNTLPPRKEKRS